MKILYEKYLKINEDIKLLTVEKENLKADIKLQLEVLGTDRFEDDAVVVSLKESVRTTFQSKIMQSFLNEEQLAQAKKETSFSTLRVDLK